MSQVTSRREVLTLNDDYRLEYTTIGSHSINQKPLLLFIVGSSGLGAFYHYLAIELSDSFTSVYYDRRGFRSPRSALVEAGDAINTRPSTVIAKHAEDAAALIVRLTGADACQGGRQPGAYVFATSFGATVALCLTLNYPTLVNKAILHEPMLPNLLPEGQEREKYLADFRAVYHAEAPFDIFTQRFLSVNGRPSTPAAMTTGRSTMATSKENSFWSKGLAANLAQSRSEGLAVTSYHPDFAQIAALSNKLALTAGLESKEFPIYRMFLALAQKAPTIQGGIQDIEGGHFTFVSRKHIGLVSAKIKAIFGGQFSDDGDRRASRTAAKM